MCERWCGALMKSYGAVAGVVFSAFLALFVVAELSSALRRVLSCGTHRPRRAAILLR